jgi:hypothetical protein
MHTPAGTSEDDEPVSQPACPTVSVHRTRPDRLVFSESDNTDGWIATDLAVEPPR